MSYKTNDIALLRSCQTDPWRRAFIPDFIFGFCKQYRGYSLWAKGTLWSADSHPVMLIAISSTFLTLLVRPLLSDSHPLWHLPAQQHCTDTATTDVSVWL